jgi:hypothetical protein
MRNWIVGLLLAGIFISAMVGFVISGHGGAYAQQQSQPQGPDETSMTLLGQCVYNNNANSIRAMTMQRQLMAMQEQEKATAEYWARWIGAAQPNQPEHEFRIPLEVTPSVAPNGNTPVPKTEEKK